MSHELTRRGLLTGASALGLAALTSQSPRAAAAAEPGSTAGALDLPQVQGIGPRSIADPTELPGFPDGLKPYRWKWARSRGVTLREALQSLQPDDILVLPEDEIPYEIDTSAGFRRDRLRYISMVYAHRGIVGLGPGAVIRPSASAYQAGPQTYAQGMQEKMIETRQPGAYFANFTMQGRDLGGIGYNAIWARGDNTLFENLLLQGAHRGFDAKPPGEAAAICGYKGANMIVRNVEVDGRDETGRTVGSSPLMFNRQADTRVENVFLHHTRIGMPTFWQCHNAYVFQMNHSQVADAVPGDKRWVPGVNIEACRGTFTFDVCVLATGYGTNGNRCAHVNIGNLTEPVEVVMRGTVFDAGPRPGQLFVQQYGSPQQRPENYHVTDADGNPVPLFIAT